MNEPRIVLADTTEIDKFEEGYARFLELIGLPAALITDDSTIWDFQLDKAERHRLSLAVGYIVHDDTLVWKVMRDLEKEQ